MKIKLLATDADGVVKIAIDGDVTEFDFPTGAPNPLETLLGSDWPTKRMLLDLATTSYFGSAAIAWLIATNRACRQGGGAIIPYDIQPAVLQILTLLHVGKTVHLADTEEAARKAMVRPAAPPPPGAGAPAAQNRPAPRGR
jgi:anti-anti-sigma regulatory factor